VSDRLSTGIAPDYVVMPKRSVVIELDQGVWPKGRIKAGKCTKNWSPCTFLWAFFKREHQRQVDSDYYLFFSHRKAAKNAKKRYFSLK
jgi:hypothetical protein